LVRGVLLALRLRRSHGSDIERVSSPPAARAGVWALPGPGLWRWPASRGDHLERSNCRRRRHL
jgi:hypothetical protein